MTMRLPLSLTLLLWLGTAACSSIPPIPGVPEPPTVPATVPADIADEVYERVNGYRVGQRLAPLGRNGVLDRLAREHSDRVAAGSVAFGHDGFESRFDRARADLGIARMSENVATSNHPTTTAAQSAADGWIGSPGHLRNLTGDFTLTGIGVARSRAGDFFVTQIYAAR